MKISDIARAIQCPNKRYMSLSCLFWKLITIVMVLCSGIPIERCTSCHQDIIKEKSYQVQSHIPISPSMAKTSWGCDENLSPQMVRHFPVCKSGRISV